MTIANTASANEILNTVGVEVGIGYDVDPFASTDPNYVQLQFLINTACKELARLYDWEFLMKEHSIVTVVAEDGVYPLPDDFLRMINQTGWERSNRNPMSVLSPQQWQYLKGIDIASEQLWVSFRVQQGDFTILPSPVQSVYDIVFEYITNLFAISSIDQQPTNRIELGADIPLFDELLLSRLLKVKWYESKGMDSSKAQDDLNQAFALVTAVDKSSPILRAGRAGGGIKLIDPLSSLSGTNYGSP